MAERGDNFWTDEELLLKEFGKEWWKQHKVKDGEKQEEEEKYGMAGTFDSAIEKVFGLKIALVGPMIDGYLKRIGVKIYRKLAGGKRGRTGLAIPITEYIPWQIMNPLTGLLAGYGADVNFVNGKKKGKHQKDKYLIFIMDQSSA